MRTVEILTSQNVIIRYRIATTVQRAAAFLIDFVILGLFVIVLSATFWGNFWPYFFGSLVITFYTLVSEVFFNGYTAGKYMLGIRVAKVDGSEPQFSDYFGRWATRIIEIYMSLGIVATVLSSTSKRGQRMGDSISGTVLIQIKHTSPYQLNSIASLANANTYTPLYPEIVQLTEAEVIQIKRLVDRHELHPNRITSSLIKKVGTRLIDRFDLQRKPSADKSFLKEIIREYVILSR